MAVSTKWAGLKLPDLNRPAFLMPRIRALVAARKCPACKKDICPEDFAPWHARERAEYSISGTCFKCQADMFTPAPKADDELDTVALMRGLHRIQERGGSAQDEERFLRLAGFPTVWCHAEAKQAEDTKQDLDAVDEQGLGCDNCYACISGGGKPCVNDNLEETAVEYDSLDSPCSGDACEACYACTWISQRACTNRSSTACVNEPEKHFCAIGECEPRKEMPKANEACAECLKSIMENSVMVGEISRTQNRFSGYDYSCSFHGRNVECVEDRNDKRETWQCRECGAEGEFRVWYMHDCM